MLKMVFKMLLFRFVRERSVASAHRSMFCQVAKAAKVTCKITGTGSRGYCGNGMPLNTNYVAITG